MSEERYVWVPCVAQDQARVEALAKEFRLRGVTVVVEVVDPHDGAMSATQQAATLVWIGWTATSAQSPRIQADAAEARDRGALYQALLDPVSIPTPFDQWPLFDLRDFTGAPSHEPMADITERLRHRLSPPDLEPKVAQFPATVRQRDSLISIAPPKAINLPSPWVMAAIVALAIIGLTLIADHFGLTSGPLTRWWNSPEMLPLSTGANP